MIAPITTKKDLKNVLGTFWTDFFDQSSVRDGLLQGQSLMSRQLEKNLDEIRDTLSIEKTPVHHTEVWRSIHLTQDMDTGSFYPLLYDDNAANYGGGGSLPIHNREFVYGGFTDARGLIARDQTPEEVMFLTDSFENPSFVLVNGLDFRIQNGYFVFIDDITLDPRFISRSTTEIYNKQVVYHLWAYGCKFDLLTAARQWGYLLSFEDESSKSYNRALWALWKARRFGLTPDTFNELLSVYFQCPRSLTDREVVQRIYEVADRYTIITDSNTYTLAEGDVPNVSEGQVLTGGQFIGQAVSVVNTGPAAFVRPSMKRLPEHVDLRLLGDSDLIETRYIYFRTDDAPSTIEKNPFDNYSPSYAVINTTNGSNTVRVASFYRAGQARFTLEIDPAMLVGPQTQRGSIQIYSVTGVPLFSEPYTGSIEPVDATFQLVTDEDDLLKIDSLALTDRVKSVKRVALISMFDDTENISIKTLLQSLSFTSGDAISVKVFQSIDFYTELNGVGHWTSAERDALLNYDMVLVNSASGVLSRLGPDGELLDGPTINNSEFIESVVASLDQRLVSLKRELTTADTDLVWLMNYLNNDSRSADAERLYPLCGLRGIPLLNTSDGDIFYSYGLFSELNRDEIPVYEVNNSKTDVEYRIPAQPWPSQTGTGVTSVEKSVPVYSKRVDITGRSPRLETTLTPGYQYTYRISGITEA